MADAVEATIAAALHGRPGWVYNVAGRSAHSLRTGLDLVARRLPALRLVAEAAHAGEVHDSAADLARSAADLAYVPSWDLAAGLDAQIAWQRAAGGKCDPVPIGPVPSPPCPQEDRTPTEGSCA